MSIVKEIKDGEFTAEVLESKVPVLVDFFATWCPPCQRQLPVLDKLAKSYGDKIKIVKLNTDTQQEWAGRLGVRSIPTLAFYQDGRLVAKESGFMPYSQLSKAFDILLSSPAA